MMRCPKCNGTNTKGHGKVHFCKDCKTHFKGVSSGRPPPQPQPPVSPTSVAVTGKLQNFKSKGNFEEWVEMKGWTYHTSLRAGTQYLVYANTGRHGRTAKVQKAQSQGITVVSEEDFLNNVICDSP